MKLFKLGNSKPAYLASPIPSEKTVVKAFAQVSPSSSAPDQPLCFLVWPPRASNVPSSWEL